MNILGALATLAILYLSGGVFVLGLSLWQEVRRCRYARQRIAQKHISLGAALSRWETTPKWMGLDILKSAHVILIYWPLILIAMIVLH